MRRCIAFIAFVAASFAFAEAPPGVPRELARERAAAVSELRYRLSFALLAHAESTRAHEELTFQLSSPRPLLLDYRDGTVERMSVNGSEVPVSASNGHLELAADKLRAGENTVAIDFVSQIALAGKPLTRYEDRDDGSEYIYTLFVPMDASMAFPCFDQPDLKGRFRLEVSAPAAWTVVSNTAPASSMRDSSGAQRTVFAETQPISTYLFAFAAGPFRKIERAGMPAMYFRQAKLASGQKEAPEVQEITARGIAYLSRFFAQPFPFPKYDMVVIPGLAYGGMEHAGATFLREESVLFRTAPTHTDLLNRDILALHELTHQWFGDLVTMRWFDDLWLKEGFAQYMAYQTLAALKPGEQIWKRFYESIKPEAYEIDVTQGTTPIYQDIPNLKDAKSAYGAIVYDKAPGMLKQLAYLLGEEHFRDGLRVYLKEHLYGNAEWADLVRAFERVSGQKLERWADMWIRHRGMPQVDVSWSCAGGRLSRLSLSQHDVLDQGSVWPMVTEVLLGYDNGRGVRLRARLEGATADLAEARGKACPVFVFANDQDYAYGRFLLDAHSQAAVSQRLGAVRDLFLRTLLWGSLWESVRVAEMPPRQYLELAQKLLPSQDDESLTESILANSATALHHYVDAPTRQAFVPALEQMAGAQMVRRRDQGLRIIWFRGLRRIAETAAGRERLKELLAGKLAVPGVELRPLDRWNMVAALIALGDPEADALLAAERQRDHTGDGLKYAYMAEAARPDPRTKQKYFNDYLHDRARPEDWVEQSLRTFNYWNQSELTAPYLRPALDAMPQVKRERKIFFLLTWLEAFIGGQNSAASADVVHNFLRTAELDQDLRLKVLQYVDELDRTVRIRAKFPQ
jgi:aminopeptidase N